MLLRGNLPNLLFTFALLTSSKSMFDKYSRRSNTFSLLLSRKSMNRMVMLALMIAVAEVVGTKWNGNKNGEERMVPTWL